MGKSVSQGQASSPYFPPGSLTDTSATRDFFGYDDPRGAGATMGTGDKWYRLGVGAPPPPPTLYPPFWGLAYGTNSVSIQHETDAGRPVGVRRIYSNADAASVTSTINFAASLAAGNRVPWASFPFPTTTANVKDGIGGADAWAQDIVTRMAAIGKPSMVTFNHEGNLVGKDPTLGLDYAQAHDRLYLACQGISNLVKIGPVTTGFEMVYRTNGPHHDDCWPGVVHEDFLGYDTYNYHLTAKGGSWWQLSDTYWTNPGRTPSNGQALGFQEFAESKGVPWAIGEFACSGGGAGYNRFLTGGSSDGQTGGHVDWISNGYNSAVTLGGCLALCWFDSPYNSTTNAASQWTPTDIVGSAAHLLTSQFNTVDGKTHIADHGNPSKYAEWIAILQNSTPWRAAW